MPEQEKENESSIESGDRIEYHILRNVFQKTSSDHCTHSATQSKGYEAEAHPVNTDAIRDIELDVTRRNGP